MIQKSAISAAIICILLVSLIAFIEQTSLGETTQEQKPFLVGVTYGGNNIQDAKILINKVANYTNLFVLQSGILKNDANAVNEIGDYAVAKGLHFAAYFDVLTVAENAEWVGTAKQRWGDMFAGVYLGDEPGGKMLDGATTFTLSYTRVPIESSTNGTGYIELPSITAFKSQEGTVDYCEDYSSANFTKNNRISFSLDGFITVDNRNTTSETIWFNDTYAIIQNDSQCTIRYSPNGSITIWETFTKTTMNEGSVISYDLNGIPTFHGITTEVLRNDFYTMENGSKRIAQVETYQQIKTKNPIPDCNATANLYINKTKEPVKNLRTQWNISKGDFPVFTADYGLYWWDYKSGYDMVLAELGWNNSVAQEIALVRGAANVQGKSWGTILTWKYTHAPYLADGAEIFDQMKTSYENGAQYIILFNYAKDTSGPYGTLQEEHFQALERFWNDVVQNSTVVHGGVKAQAALVLPSNYGWGMRNPSDIIWGIWEPNSTSSQIWTQVQSKLEQYGAKLDIVYDDPAYPVAGNYTNVYVWNKTT